MPCCSIVIPINSTHNNSYIPHKEFDISEPLMLKVFIIRPSLFNTAHYGEFSDQ